MKERPILMSAPMVRALLAGAKTQTRRPVKRILPVGAVDPGGYWGPLKEECLMDKDHLPSSLSAAPTNLCPYGEPRDRLWVREAWRTAKLNDHLSPKEMVKACREAGWKSGTAWAPIEYLADGHRKNWDTFPNEVGRYRHGRFMPRDYSRITLEITDVRVQRLQEISGEDAIAEGVWESLVWDSWEHQVFKAALNVEQHTEAQVECMTDQQLNSAVIKTRDDFAIAGYAALWEAIHGAGSWAANPWAWALTFKVVKPQKGSI